MPELSKKNDLSLSLFRRAVIRDWLFMEQITKEAINLNSWRLYHIIETNKRPNHMNEIVNLITFHENKEQPGFDYSLQEGLCFYHVLLSKTLHKHTFVHSTVNPTYILMGPEVTQRTFNVIL